MKDLSLPDVPGIITADEVLQTARSIADLQVSSGMIPWFPDGHCDPWNHVETAMALDVAGLHTEAERAYEWLRAIQHDDGSWHAYYLGDGVQDAKLDTNVVAYIATGVWHHWLVTADIGFCERFWPVVDAAMAFVLDLQTARGEIIWARHTDGRPWTYALLTGSSSIHHSLRCAMALADLLGEDRPEWDLAAAMLGEVIATQPSIFEPKDRWAMDWYYPVLAGVVTGDAGAERLASRWDTFVIPGRGVRCVSNQPWVTAAETAECALAHLANGQRDVALELLATTRAHRCDDGAYLTGLVHPEQVSYPDGERTAYTAAAVILAADALSGASPASGIFVADAIPGSRSDDPVTD